MWIHPTPNDSELWALTQAARHRSRVSHSYFIMINVHSYGIRRGHYVIPIRFKWNDDVYSMCDRELRLIYNRISDAEWRIQYRRGVNKTLNAEQKRFDWIDGFVFGPGRWSKLITDSNWPKVEVEWREHNEPTSTENVRWNSRLYAQQFDETEIKVCFFVRTKRSQASKVRLVQV